MKPTRKQASSPGRQFLGTCEPAPGSVVTHLSPKAETRRCVCIDTVRDKTRRDETDAVVVVVFPERRCCFAGIEDRSWWHRVHVCGRMRWSGHGGVGGRDRGMDDETKAGR